MRSLISALTAMVRLSLSACRLLLPSGKHLPARFCYILCVVPRTTSLATLIGPTGVLFSRRSQTDGKIAISVTDPQKHGDGMNAFITYTITTKVKQCAQ